MLPWHRIHDTQFLLFLFDPHSKKFGLKPASEALLGWPQDEKNALDDWIWENRKALEAEYPDHPTLQPAEPGGKRRHITRSNLGAWIAQAPGELVGWYAKGDVRRTLALFKHLFPIIRRNGMEEAYNRERKLLPILMENERRGLRTDVERLREETPIYQQAIRNVETSMRLYLDAPDLNFDNDTELAETFVSRGVVHEDRWVRTEKSNQLSVAKDNLPPDAFADPTFAAAFGYRNRMATCLKMFMQPWLAQAEKNGGMIHTRWNQVLGSRGGARTGRPSMTKPNLLNVSKPFEGRDDGYEHPHGIGIPLPPLPEVRRYITADEEQEFLHRDFDGQELRIFAHFESGDLRDAYLENPDLDPHDWVRQELISLVNVDLGRTPVKAMNFQGIYGGGVPAISKKLNCSMVKAREFKAFHERALPGRKILSDEILRLVRRGEPIRTWGGRLYHVEPPSTVNGRVQTWEYKLINYLVQGSAADVTKEAIIRWYYGGGPSNGARFLLTVYDEINISSARASWRENMAFLKEVMNGVELDVPMRSSGKHGERWGQLEKCE
jgi:DNA polymerase I-like protein with 3'-5' exonuclease and polymerase domains